MSPRSRRALLAALAVVLTMAAGCSGSDDSDGSAVSTGGTVSPPADAANLSPTVAEPRDLRGFSGRPCDIVTSTQLAEFGLGDPAGNPGVGISPDSQTCEWGAGGSDVPAGFDVTFDPSRDIFGQRSRSAAGDPVFEVIQIAGLPALVHQAVAGGSRCLAVVKIADQQGLSVGWVDKRPPYEDPCGNAERVAAAIVSNLPPLG